MTGSVRASDRSSVRRSGAEVRDLSSLPGWKPAQLGAPCTHIHHLRDVPLATSTRPITTTTAIAMRLSDPLMMAASMRSRYPAPRLRKPCSRALSVSSLTVMCYPFTRMCCDHEMTPY